MIITCESCKTRFRLDPQLIKGLSSKVRCSRCQHVFFVSREDDLAIDQVILEPELPDREVALGSKPPQFIPSRFPDQPVVTRQAKSQRLFLMLGLLMLVAAGAAVYWYFSSASKAPSVAVGSKKGPGPVAEKAAVSILPTMQAYFLENDHIGQIFVVEGEVRNDSPASVSFVLVEGKLYALGGKLYQNQKAYCGNIMRREELSKLTVAELQNRMMNREGKDLSNVHLASKAQVPFQVVFNNLPGINQLSDYSVEVTGAEID